jgi:imidazoleglycerol-phosphate dehydratase
MVKITRTTKETDIICELEINNNTPCKIDTGVGFLNHMIESFCKHSGIYIKLQCKGDTFVDDHHSVEDVAIVIGQALNQEVFPIKEVERFGEAKIVMDEACVECVLDLSNRAFLEYVDFNIFGKVGEFDVELVEEFFRALVFNFGITTHLVFHRGRNKHHIIEATFKAFAISLRRALKTNKTLGIPSTKGTI